MLTLCDVYEARCDSTANDVRTLSTVSLAAASETVTQETYLFPRACGRNLPARFYCRRDRLDTS